MAKLKRSAAAYAQRVKMATGDSVFAIVEGKHNDRPFYDRILKTSSSIAPDKYHLQLAEELTLDGKSAGGKTFALTLFEYFDRNSYLSQRNSSGTNSILFMLDRDYDHLVGSAVDSRHVIYTQSADVECEILMRGDLESAVCFTYGIDSSVAQEALVAIPNPHAYLARQWRDWITVLVLSLKFNVHGAARFSGKSTINTDTYGEVVESALRELVSSVENLLPDEADVSGMRSRLEQIYHRGEYWLLPKGRWVVGFIAHLIENKVDVPHKTAGKNELVSTCLSTVDFSPESEWLARYHSKIEQAMAV